MFLTKIALSNTFVFVTLIENKVVDCDNAFTDIEEVYTHLNFLKTFSRRARDLLTSSIEATLDDISMTPLCDVPEDEPVTVEQYLDNTRDTCQEAAKVLAKLVI